MTDKEIMSAIGNIEDILTVRDCIWLKTAKEALEKQLPKKPFERHHAIDGLYEVKWGLCHTCEEVISDDKKYCPNCGQAIDWSEEDEYEM